MTLPVQAGRDGESDRGLLAEDCAEDGVSYRTALIRRGIEQVVVGVKYLTL